MTARACQPVALACAVVIWIATGTGCFSLERARGHWWDLSRERSGQAPDPATTPEAVVQVYAARTVGWRGLLAVHTWIAVKQSGASSYTRYEGMGWGVSRGAPALRVNRTGPDNHWFGSRPDLLVDLRGPDVDAVIERVQAAVAAYPYAASYRTWPGPTRRRRPSARTIAPTALPSAWPRAARVSSSLRWACSASWPPGRRDSRS